MTQPTINDVQAVEPILTNLLVGYKQADDRFVATKVFPAVPVPNDSGTFYKFDKKYFFTNEMKVRAPGGDYPHSGFALSTDTYKTVQWALAYMIADEVRANSQVPMDLESAATRWLAQKSLIRKEVSFAEDFMKTGVWGTDATVTKWSDYQGSDPVGDILTGKRTISNNTGMDPNTLVMGYIVLQKLVNHPDLIDRVKYNVMGSAATVENALATLFGVQRILVGKATYSNTNEAENFAASAIIDDDALLCYTSGAPGLFDASAGYTFTWAPGGGEGIVLRHRIDRNQADEIQVKEQWDQKVVAADLGYFFADCVD